MPGKRHIVDYGLAWSGLNMRHEAVAGRFVHSGEPRRRKVAIYGAGLGREGIARCLADPSWEVWALNTIPPLVHTATGSQIRADRWFDIHQAKAQSADDMRWIAGMQVPIYVPQDLLSGGPMCVEYPLERVECESGMSYWACTFAYQIALAMDEGFREIALFGVELSRGTMRERTVEWACVSFWIGLAMGSGITVTLPSAKAHRLCRHPFRYGFEYDEEIRDVKDYIAEARQADAEDAVRESVGG